ncbi:MAG: hypothetical protein AAF242_05805 [Bacteroidota bacterium]
MELTELKDTWGDLKISIENQKSLNHPQIMDIVQNRYQQKLSNIIRYERYGVPVLIIGAGLIIWNAKLYDTVALQLCAISSVVIMLLLPVLTFTTILRMRNLDMGLRNIQDTIREFAKRRSQFLMVQKWSIGLTGLMMFTILPVVVKIMDGKDIISEGNSSLFWFMVLGLVFLFFFSRWGYQCYQRISASAGEMLKDLE